MNKNDIIACILDITVREIVELFTMIFFYPHEYSIALHEKLHILRSLRFKKRNRYNNHCSIKF